MIDVEIELEGYPFTIPSRFIKNTKVNESIDVISASLPISTFSFDVVGYDIESALTEAEKLTGETYKIEQNLPISVLKKINNKFVTIMKMYVKSFQKMGKNVYHFETYDYVGKLDTLEYRGRFYKHSELEDSVNRLLRSTFWDADSSFYDLEVQGFTPYSNKREALKNLLFAVGGTIDTQQITKDVYIKK